MRRLIEGVDYFVQFMAFPNMASPVFTALNDDGTFTIVLNTRFPREVLSGEMRHELEHMADDHFFDARPVAYLEAEADGNPLAPPSDAAVRRIPLYPSPQALADRVLGKPLPRTSDSLPAAPHIPLKAHKNNKIL